MQGQTRGLVSQPSGLSTRGGCLGSAPAQGGFAGWTRTLDSNGECTLTITADASGNDAMPNSSDVIAVRTIYGVTMHQVDPTVDHIVFQGPNKTKLNNTSAQYFHGYNNQGGFKTFASNGFVDTSAVTNMNSMFASDFAMTSLDVSGFDTSNVTNMNSMFASNNNMQLTTIKGLTDFRTQNVTDMGSMFYASRFRTLDVSSFDTQNVTSMASMFLYDGFLASIVGLDHFSTPALTNTSFMFERVATQSLDLSSFDTSHVTNMQSMFTDAWLLKSVKGLEKLNTSKVRNMGQIFTGTAFTSLDLSGWDTANVQGQQGVALPSGLQELTLGVRGTPDSYPGQYKSLQVNGLPQANNGLEKNGYTGKWVKVVDEPIASNDTLKDNEYSADDLVKAINVFPHTQIPAATYVWEQYRDVNTNVTAPSAKYKVDGKNATLRSHGYSVNVPQADGTSKPVDRFASMVLPAGPTNLRYANGDHASHDYTFAGWKDTATNTSYDAGESVIPAANGTTVSSQWNLLRDASGLNDEIVKDGKLAQADYTPTTWSAFKKALDAANAALDGNGDQGEVDNALKALQSANKGLEIVPDKLGLTTLIDMANAKQQADYRPSTWAALTTAIASANAVNADANATHSEVTAAETALKNAIDGLAQKADKSSLSVLINKAAAAHQNDYTAASWAPLMPALNSAKAVMNDADATQSNVNDAQAKLLDAFTGLDKPAKVEQVPGKPAPAASSQTTVNNRIVAQRPVIASAPVLGAQNSGQNGSAANGNDTVKEPKKNGSNSSNGSKKYVCKTDTGHYVTLSDWIEPASSSSLPRCTVHESAPEVTNVPKTQFNWWVIVALVFIVATAILAIQYYRSEHSQESGAAISQHAQQR